MVVHRSQINAGTRRDLADGRVAKTPLGKNGTSRRDNPVTRLGAIWVWTLHRTSH